MTSAQLFNTQDNFYATKEQEKRQMISGNWRGRQAATTFIPNNKQNN